MAFSRYYRHTLTPRQQELYDALLQGLEARRIEIPAPYFSVQDSQKIMHAVDYDHPQLFYVDFGHIRLLRRGTSCAFLVDYLVDAAEQQRLTQKLETVVSTVHSLVAGKPMKEVALLLHDWLVRSCSYGNCTEFPGGAHNIVGALLYRKCVCEGYAKAYKYLADRLRMRCIVAVGRGIHPDGTSGGHAWNVVKLDGSCYHVDVTFDLLFAGRYCSRAYFLLSTREILLDHSIDAELPLPDCPLSGGVLPVVSGTVQLLQLLEKDCRSGVAYSEVRLTKGFTGEKLMEMIRHRLTEQDAQWYGRLQSYWYGDNSRMLFVRWKS